VLNGFGHSYCHIIVTIRDCNISVFPGPKKKKEKKKKGFIFKVNLIILTVRVSNIYTLD
jgi:hypothetical protein